MLPKLNTCWNKSTDIWKINIYQWPAWLTYKVKNWTIECTCVVDSQLILEK